MANKRTIVNGSVRTEQKQAVNDPKITKGQYLNAILAGYPGQGVKLDPAYSPVPPGCIGSRANGMFLN